MAQLHLIQMFFHTPINHILMTWVDGKDQQLDALEDFGFWQALAKKLENACFDGVFFADTSAVHISQNDKPTTEVRHGVAWPNHDPMPLVAAMAAATQHLGFAVTLSLAGTPPYLAVRRISSLDYLSRGRIGWNVVTGFLEAERNAIGVPNADHDDRYDQADEYMALCYELWESVDAGAIVKDKRTGVFADESKVKIVDFKGKYYSCRALCPTIPSRQGRPVIFQAGSSARGMQFATEHGDYIFAIQPNVAGMQKFAASMREASATLGKRTPPGIFFGVQPVVGSTEEEARRRIQELTERIPLEAALRRFSGPVGIDLTQFDPDAPIEDLPQKTKASQGIIAAAKASKARTIRELVLNRSHMMRIIGTPEQVADSLERAWRDSGCHGFILSPTTNPDSVEVFADQVVPILQRKGLFRKSYERDTFRELLSLQ